MSLLLWASVWKKITSSEWFLLVGIRRKSEFSEIPYHRRYQCCSLQLHHFSAQLRLLPVISRVAFPVPARWHLLHWSCGMTLTGHSSLWPPRRCEDVPPAFSNHWGTVTVSSHGIIKLEGGMYRTMCIVHRHHPTSVKHLSPRRGLCSSMI